MYKKTVAWLVLAVVIFAGVMVGAVVVYRQGLKTEQSSASERYVALGDSVAAGLGLNKTTRKGSPDALCGRAAQAYPNLVGSMLKLQVQSVACSGATTADFSGSQTIKHATEPPQLDAVFNGRRPKLVSITIGANDVHWTDLLLGCYRTDCTSPSYQARANGYIQTLAGSLQNVFNTLQKRGGSTVPKTVITGYYDPVSVNCASTSLGITPAKITWISNETDALNNTIQASAKHYSFVTFAPVSFAGHDVCSTGTSWVQGVTDVAPLHPTADGQAAIAAAVISAVQ